MACLVEEELRRRGVMTKRHVAACGRIVGGQPFSRGHIDKLLASPLHIGEIAHRGTRYPRQHPAIIDAATWQAVQAQPAHRILDDYSASQKCDTSFGCGRSSAVAQSDYVSSFATSRGRK